MARKFYAEHCPYGWRTMSESDRLFAFDSLAERDEWVNDYHHREFWNELTYQEARRNYPPEARKYAAHPNSQAAAQHRIACMRGERW